MVQKLYELHDRMSIKREQYNYTPKNIFIYAPINNIVQEIINEIDLVNGSGRTQVLTQWKKGKNL